jgi:lipid II isoglutaminyl synthase (glutamine-hydrolysing)
LDRATVAVLASKAAGAASRWLGRGGGTALPGLVAERLEPNIVARLARDLGRGVAIVTGTNGKTTTARMLAGIHHAAGTPVLHNRSGSNLMRGLAATVTAAAGIDGRIPRAARTAGVLEVDEATLPTAVAAVRPRVVAFTNLFRDQLDRYGEVDSIAALWRRAVSLLPDGATIVLNADDPSVAALRHDARVPLLTFGVEDTSVIGGVEEHPADARWCGRCGTEFRYTARFFWHVGHWSCPGCGDARPAPEISATAVVFEGDRTRIDMMTPAGPLSLTLPLTGLYNVYNALAAVAAACAMGVPPEPMRQALSTFSAAFGRQEALRVRGRDVRLFLCKNPAGVNQVLRTITAPHPSASSKVCADPSIPTAGPVSAGEGANAGAAECSALERGSGMGAGGEGSYLIILNDGIADGRDVSWIWDVDYELLAGHAAAVIVSGTRAADMALRLKYAGLGDRLAIEDDLRQAVSHAISRTPAGEPLYVLPTYTAMLAVRDYLAALAGRPRFWNQ